jgi:hypothetical protein
MTARARANGIYILHNFAENVGCKGQVRSKAGQMCHKRTKRCRGIETRKGTNGEGSELANIFVTRHWLPFFHFLGLCEESAVSNLHIRPKAEDVPHRHSEAQYQSPAHRCIAVVQCMTKHICPSPRKHTRFCDALAARWH